jgi:MerR family transcriptional regulator, thiopeptide resistance regulator
MPFTVGDLAKLTGVTVRALHHYDEIGLVRPSQRTAAGYRLYTDTDVHRLQQVLLFRELGLPLGEIAAAIDQAPNRDELLRHHRDVLIAKRAGIDAMLASLDQALSHQENRPMQPDDVKTMFDGFDPTAYEDEARERWGETDTYKESTHRTRSYGKAEWDAIKRDWAAIYADLAAEMTANTPVTDARVQTIVERHRQHLERWFYPCSTAMHKNLGAMYVADARFAANIDKTAPGLAQFLSDAIAAS